MLANMLPTHEGLAIHSVEAFLSADEVAQVIKSVDALKASKPAGTFEAGHNGKSVHHLDVLHIAGEEAARLFSPQGRIEIALGSVLPDVLKLLERAFFRRIEDIRRVYPSATWPVGFTYVEYGAGQFCNSHADGAFAGKQVGACSVRLDDGTEGGEFYIETCGSDEIWTHDTERPDLVLPALYDNPWFAQVPKTSWLAQPARGTALFWGAHLVHGTRPIRAGIAKKIIAWIEGP